jgi:protein tyrosine phosphatase
LNGGSPSKVDETNYINACYIKSSFKEQGTPNGLIIATQGPQPHTCESFWKMVLQNNVTKIVTLCKNIGDTYHDDACAYFPSHGSSQYQSISVANKSKVNQMEHVDVRNLLVSDGTQSIMVQHNHFKSWPDF